MPSAPRTLRSVLPRCILGPPPRLDAPSPQQKFWPCTVIARQPSLPYRGKPIALSSPHGRRVHTPRILQPLITSPRFHKLQRACSPEELFLRCNYTCGTDRVRQSTSIQTFRFIKGAQPRVLCSLPSDAPGSDICTTARRRRSPRRRGRPLPMQIS